MTIGERIKARRAELGMTQADLAKRIGTTYQAISKYENGCILKCPRRTKPGAARLEEHRAIRAGGSKTPGNLVTL